MTKACPKCDRVLPSTEFYKSSRNPDGLQGVCKSCNRISARSWAQKHSYQRNVANRKWRSDLKNEIISEYGGKCVCCEEAEPTFLSIDHINNDGGQHRKELGASSGNTMYTWLKKNRFPKDNFQLLCFNCNIGKKIAGGACPHKKQRKHGEK